MALATTRACDARRRALEAAFGDEYRRYCARVGRWGPRFGA